FLAEYAAHASAIYTRVTELAATLAARADELGRHPDVSTLAAARAAWLEGREAYGVTEALRFYGGPIDRPAERVRKYVNAWPVDESYIDAVRGRPDGGIILDPEHYPILDAAVLRAANQRGGETNVCMGWHAIEFLLWGQDFDPNGPGNRSPDDFRVGAAK